MASAAPNYSWNGVMGFLKDQEYKAQEREQKLIIDKKALEERVKRLEDELGKQIQINKELVKKMRVMDFAMLQQKRHISNNSGGSGVGANTGAGHQNS